MSSSRRLFSCPLSCSSGDADVCISIQYTQYLRPAENDSNTFVNAICAEARGIERKNVPKKGLSQMKDRKLQFLDSER